MTKKLTPTTVTITKVHKGCSAESKTKQKIINKKSVPKISQCFISVLSKNKQISYLMFYCKRIKQPVMDRHVSYVFLVFSFININLMYSVHPRRISVLIHEFLLKPHLIPAPCISIKLKLAAV